MIRQSGPPHRLLLALVAGALAGCGEASEPPLPPDPILRDSLGVTSSGQVVEVSLRQGRGGETMEPDTLRVGSSRFAAFRSDDHWPRTVRFLLDRVAPEGRAFLREADALESPPLVHAGARWVVEVKDAPPGAYPFIVMGPRRPGHGVLLVEPAPVR